LKENNFKEAIDYFEDQIMAGGYQIPWTKIKKKDL
jgi:hypothetical protein